MITFQEILHRLTTFWANQGCVIHQGHDVEVGAGTFNPATFMRSLGPEPYNTAYVEPSRRPQDARYGENPNRVQLFHQFQVVMKPSPPNVQDLYLQSLEAIGLNLKEHDIRFVHDDWESPTLGAWGLGWEVWCDGMEITQFTYFQSVAGFELNPIPVELTYGLERLCMYLQNVDTIFDIQWNDHLTFREITKRSEYEWSAYNFEHASTEMWFRHFEDYEKEAHKLAALHLPLPAYDFVMKASHAFNMLEARGTLSVTERTGYIARIRDLARLAATEYLASRERMQYPLLRIKKEEREEEIVYETKIFDCEKTESLLIEIGTEELPSSYVSAGMLSLEQGMKKLLKELGLTFGEHQIFGTPRRLAILFQDVPCGTRDVQEKKKGPATSVAFHDDGNLSPQGAGFLRRLGIENITREQVANGAIPSLSIESHKGTDYLFVENNEKGKSTAELLAASLPKMIRSMTFPKRMRWGDGDLQFGRPIHSLMALHGKLSVPFSLAGVESSRITSGHRQRDPVEISIPHADEYVTLLRKHFVMVDDKERVAKIEKDLREFTNGNDFGILEKERVLREVVNLVEWPELHVGSFEESFLDVPQEVLISEMVEHQRYFPIADTSGTLLNKFLLTADTTPTPLIVSGNEKVLSARLADGAFLYAEDRKTPLTAFAEKLANITFHKDLGTMEEKTGRIGAIADMLYEVAPRGADKTLREAAELCKADLATALVGEFPTLQGVIGHHYALEGLGLDPEAALAIEEHWKPRFEGDILPESDAGILLSLADKLDNLCAYFSIGIRASSSSDPYALRRQAIGILRLLIEKEIHVDLEKLIARIFTIMPSREGQKELLEFISHRLKSVLEEYSFSKVEIAAVAAGTITDPYDTFLRVRALHNFRKTEQFTNLLEVYKRAKGQLGASSGGDISPGLLQDEAEKKLYDHIDSWRPQWQRALEERTYPEAFELLASFQPPLADLFSNVKIMDDDPKIRENRLSLLHSVFSGFNDLLNFNSL